MVLLLQLGKLANQSGRAGGGVGVSVSSLTLDYDFLQNSGAAISAATRRGPALTFARASSGTNFDENALLVTAATNEPRFDHDPVTGAALGLLIEEARTNLCLQSEDFSTTWVDAAATSAGISTNTTVAPDGNTTADTLTDDSAVNFEGLKQTFTVANDSTSWTVTAYIKKDSDETRFPELQIRLLDGTDQKVIVSLNTSTGAILERSSIGTTVISVQDAGDYWRLRATVDNNTSGNVTLEVLLFPAVGITLGTNAVTATGSIIVWGAQLENAAVPSSYIPTTTASVTRAKDVVGTTDVGWLNASAGTMFAQGSIPFVGAAERTLWVIDDNTNANLLRLYMDAAENGNFETVNSGDTNGASDGAAVIAVDTVFKLAGAYEDDSVIGCVDGTASAEDTAAGIPLTGAANNSRWGNDGAALTPFNGHIAQIKYWNVRKPNAFLVLETTVAAFPMVFAAAFSPAFV